MPARTNGTTYHFPATAAECWELGGDWYSSWCALQDAAPSAEADLQRIQREADEAQRLIAREVPESQQQRALVRQYSPILSEYAALEIIVRRNRNLKEKLEALGEHMRRNGLINENDVQTFPTDIGHWD